MKNLLRCFAWAVAIAVVFAICTPMASAQSACPSGTSPFYWLRTNADTQVPAFCFDPTNGNVAIPNLTGGFNGGTVTNPILEANGTCALPSYSFTSLSGNSGMYFSAASGIGHCYNGVEYMRGGNGQVRFGTLPFGGAAAFTNLDASWIRLAAGMFGLQESVVTIAKFGAMTNCSGIGANLGVFCFDKTLEKWQCSENNSALSNCFSGSTGYVYNAGANRWELFDSVITTALLDSNPGLVIDIAGGTFAVNGGSATQLLGQGPILHLGSASGGNSASTASGRIRITTGAVLGNDASVTQENNANGQQILAADLKTFVVTIDPVQTNAATMERVGFYGANGGTDPPTQGVFLEKANADTNWFLVTCTSPCSGGTQTRCDTGVAVAAGKITFIVTKNSTTSAAVFQKGSNTAKCTNATNIPADSQLLSTFLQVRTNEAVAKSMDLYYFRGVAALTGY